MRVTIIADASHCPETHAAGYGFWIASERGKNGGSGAFKELVATNNQAEMMALVNGLHTACKRGLVQAKDAVLLQTDCMHAIGAFEGKRTNMPPKEQELVSYMRKLCTTMEITVSFRHVKGHTAGLDPRSFVNNQCDALAKKAMRRARSAIRAQQGDLK